MALYKHDRETLPNKKLLESIIQKWSRLIFTSDHHDVTSPSIYVRFHIHVS